MDGNTCNCTDTGITGEAEQELGRVAVVTVSKMIQNLHSSPEDLKLRYCAFYTVWYCKLW